MSFGSRFFLSSWGDGEGDTGAGRLSGLGGIGAGEG